MAESISNVKKKAPVSKTTLTSQELDDIATAFLRRNGYDENGQPLKEKDNVIELGKYQRKDKPKEIPAVG